MSNVPLSALCSTVTNASYQIAIGDNDLIPPTGPYPANNYWFVVVDLSDLSVVVNELSASNDSVPSSVQQYEGDPGYMLVMMTIALQTGSIPQGALTTFLQNVGSGPQLQRLEQAISQLGTGQLGWVSYILVATTDTTDAPGFEQMNLSGESVMTLELMPVDIGGTTTYTPVSIG